MSLALVRSHLEGLIERGTDRYGPVKTPMWMSALDLRTRTYPTQSAPAAGFRPDPGVPREPGVSLLPGRRTYRNVDAPRGCSLYWDQPQIVAAHALSEITGEPEWARAADAYTTSFLERCIGTRGIFLWGNHYYYDAFADTLRRFRGDEPPEAFQPTDDDGSLHEMRPIRPAWETFWRIDPAATEREIRSATAAHLYDSDRGGFNRHADGRRSHAFLEAGGILVEALCWLATRIDDATLVERALRIARFSFDHRNTKTGLLENNPTSDRWDKHMATSEVGLWAQCLLAGSVLLGRAGHRSGSAELALFAEEAVAAWLEASWDPETQRYHGRVSVADGRPAMGPKSTLYQPGDWSDIWCPLFPGHDYPMPLAEAALTLSADSEKTIFAKAVQRWVAIVDHELPGDPPSGLYAETFGRCLHFVDRAAAAMDREDWRNVADRIAAAAVSSLSYHGMIRGHTGEFRYAAVDGVGFLLLALIRHETGNDPDLLGTGF